MDVSFLEPVFAAAGPYATVCADVTHTTESADTELELRVRALCEQLTEQGAPETVVEAVRARLLEGNEGGEAGTLKGRAVIVAADGSIVLDEVLADSPARETAEWAAHPDLLPVLRQLAGRVPHVVVVADRVGADITAAGLPGQEDEERQVEGDTFHMRKLGVGGWSQRRYMETAENQWIDNADKVAEEIASLARRLGPRFVLLAGDVRARQILSDRASGVWSDLVVTMEEGGRAAGADREPIERRTNELVAEHEARDIATAVDQVQGAGAHGLAVTGTAAVVEALRKGQVETLVVTDERDADATLLVGGSPLELGVKQQDMDALGVHGEIAPAGPALLEAAVASAAGVLVVPKAALPGGDPVAALLRYTDASTDAGN
ncbi:Vms1/Ankzf1 family peptidyl-tRNA hydrolase [Blastococcus sp. BMG 814]|uniref:Vms1/Ankzf1 family peptidyl-tRNA hydrolase n=1 Tax=Blastococcus carthaginiensis TaxID=3050034 RepID=A0ABT9IIN4_9ACTN|nr:Vms1/Ankzf1 family peptidyl-tRNA hydrolase [Blastococcus carthaginiensis]MDP5185434.1 Vms1/Ankzf1 family peptidyl-tRNA hydrolase [Blastococcus carthaginiensis]